MRQFAKRLLVSTAILLAVRVGMERPTAAEPERSAGPKGLAWQAEKDGGQCLFWQSKSGRQLLMQDLRISLTDPQARAKWSLKLEPTARKIQGQTAAWEYRLTLNDRRQPVAGLVRLEAAVSDAAGDDALLCRSELKFDRPVDVDLAVQYVCELPGQCPESVSLPDRSGQLATRSFQAKAAESGKFRLGLGAGDGGAVDLGMPVLDFCWKAAGADQKPLRLAIAADPYCGCSISATAQADNPGSSTRISVSTTYKGSVVPLTHEKRTLSLEFHHGRVDGSLRSFYRTIPEIKPGAAWTQGVHLVYYDYLSEKGEGWFKGLQTLADRIPAKHRGRVAVCLHGWYDYFQQYAYDHKTGRLMEKWTAFPGTYKVPMSLAEMHRRLKLAKDLGFRVLLYFGDGTNSDSGAPNFHPEFVLKDKAGKTFPGWKGPDSLGQPLMMDPSVPGLRDWFRGYLAALLEEYAKDVDGFVWDETFYIPTEFVSYTMKSPAYADRAMMSLVAELTQMVQQHHARNPDLVFLASDLGQTNYALVAHGTYQDSACEPGAWGPSMFANYRNCLWSCNWFPVSGQQKNRIAASRFGLPQGVSNGWGDNRGPHNMPPDLLSEVLRLFTKNLETGRVRARFLNDPEGLGEQQPSDPIPIPAPAAGETNWACPGSP